MSNVFLCFKEIKSGDKNNPYRANLKSTLSGVGGGSLFLITNITSITQNGLFFNLMTLKLKCVRLFYIHV